MIEIEQDLKDRLKRQRLDQYKAQAFTLQMDIAALKAVGDVVELRKAEQALESVIKAYNVVEVL